MTEIRAAEITERMRIREYGFNDVFTVAKADMHGDTVLVTATNGDKSTFDRDEVVELLPSRLIMVDGNPVSSCCQAEVERTCDYTDTHVFTVEDAETDEETGKVVSATYRFVKTYDGTDGENVSFTCTACGREIEQDDIEWDEG